LRGTAAWELVLHQVAEAEAEARLLVLVEAEALESLLVQEASFALGFRTRCSMEYLSYSSFLELVSLLALVLPCL
jgi:hypothetical protein